MRSPGCRVCPQLSFVTFGACAPGGVGGLRSWDSVTRTSTASAPGDGRLSDCEQMVRVGRGGKLAPWPPPSHRHQLHGPPFS